MDAFNLEVEDRGLNVQAFHHREEPVFEELHTASKLVKFARLEVVLKVHFQYLDRKLGIQPPRKRLQDGSHHNTGINIRSTHEDRECHMVPG